MRLNRKALLPASILLGLTFATTGILPAGAQGDDAAAEEVTAEDEAGLALVLCDDGEDCTELVEEADAAEPAPAAEAEAAPPVEEAAAPAAADGAVLATPGSTDESNPGGSTRPGTTPDD